MEDRRREPRVGAALERTLGQMRERPDAAAGDDRHAHRVDDGAGQLEIEAVARAVAVHRREQDLACPPLLALGGPTHRVELGGVAPAVRVDAEAPTWPAARVDGHDDTLGAELPGDR